MLGTALPERSAFQSQCRAIKRANDRGCESGVVLAIRIIVSTAAAPFLSAASNPAEALPLSTILIELDGFVRHRPQQPARAIRRAIIDADIRHGQVARTSLTTLRESARRCRPARLLPALDQLLIPSLRLSVENRQMERSSLSIDSTACESSAERATSEARALPVFVDLLARTVDGVLLRVE